jgi:hypothetical protein
MSEIEEWLSLQPFDTRVEVGGEYVYMQRYPSGSVLGAYLFDSHTPERLQAALNVGFSSALQFDAGLGFSDDGNSLVLSTWLPNVDSWLGAAVALENLLNQLAFLREVLPQWTVASEVPARSVRGSVASRDELRMRALFARK